MVQIPQPFAVELDRLKEDGDNPNAMSHSQMQALKKNIQTYGFLIPIITNEEYIIADGAQRFQAARELGMTHVPVIALPIRDVDRRILRQVLNKLKGSHDHDLDAREYQVILSENKGPELLALLGDSDKKLVQFIASTRNPPTPNNASLSANTEIPVCSQCGQKINKKNGETK